MYFFILCLMVLPFCFRSFVSPDPPIGHGPSCMHSCHESHRNFFHFFLPASNPPPMSKDIYLFYYERYKIIGINPICSRADFWGACLQTHLLSWYSHCCCWPLSLFCFLSGSGEVLLTALCWNCWSLPSSYTSFLWFNTLFFHLNPRFQGLQKGFFGTLQTSFPALLQKT